MKRYFFRPGRSGPIALALPEGLLDIISQQLSLLQMVILQISNLLIMHLVFFLLFSVFWDSAIV